MKLTSRTAIIVSFFSCSVLIFSCNGIGGSPGDAVYYYPGKNIYYDSLRSNYYYSLDGAVTWDSMSYKGSAFGNALGAAIPISRTGDTIWQNNAAHRKQYNGVLLNTVNAYTIALSKADRINKLKAVVKAATQPEAAAAKDSTPPEKGLKKFFHKIFGKKKKPAEPNDN